MICRASSQTDAEPIGRPQERPLWCADLRYLALTRQQWTPLLDHGKAPPALAAARLAGDEVTFDDCLVLASRLGLHAGGALRAAGSP
ncbi:hypothetical protein ACW69E_20365 [Streptomyces sp. SS8]